MSFCRCYINVQHSHAEKNCSLAADFANDVLNLLDCVRDSCLVACFIDCADGTACLQTTPPPTPAPTLAPTEQTLVPANQPTWQNPFGPGALNNLLFFTVPDSAALSCGSLGSRCSFVRADFVVVDDDGGTIADQIGAAIWVTSERDE